MRRPVHLLEVAVRWPPETFIGWKLEGLAERGMRVTVASKALFDRDLRLRGVELMEIPGRAPSRLAAARLVLRSLPRTAPVRLVRLVRGVLRVPHASRKRHGGAIGLFATCLPLARVRPDVVHFEWHTAAVDYLPLFDVWRCPIVTSCRGSDISVYPYVPGLEDYARRLPVVFSRASAVHCVSESLAREAVALGLDPAKARVIRPANDPRLFSPAERNGHVDRLRIVSVGWLRWEKGHEYALEALRAAVDSGVPAQLEIIGAVPSEWEGRSGERERIVHTVAELGLGDRVRLYGHASSEEITRRLRESDVLLHAAVTEGIPNAIIEAMACGLPVVTTRCGGIPEAVTDGIEGFVVAPREPMALAAALRRLWSDAALRRRMGEAGRARFEAGFTIDREHDAFLELYRALT